MVLKCSETVRFYRVQFSTCGRDTLCFFLLPFLLRGIRSSSFDGLQIIKEFHIREECLVRRPLVKKEETGSKRRHHAFRHVTHLQVVDKPSEEKQQTKNKENPPEPVLSIEVSGKVI